MNYLKKYNITDDDIVKIKEAIERDGVDIDIFLVNQDSIIGILNAFRGIGVNNLANLIIECPSMFYDPLESFQKKFEKFGDTKELANLLNKDAKNLHLIGLI